MSVYAIIPPVSVLEFKFEDVNDFNLVPFEQSETPLLYGSSIMAPKLNESFVPEKTVVVNPENDTYKYYTRDESNLVYEALPGPCVSLNAGVYKFFAIAQLHVSEVLYTKTYESVQPIERFRFPGVQSHTMIFRSDVDLERVYVRILGGTGYKVYNFINSEPTRRIIRSNAPIYFRGRTVDRIASELISLVPVNGADRFDYEVSIENKYALRAIAKMRNLHLNDIVVTDIGVIVVTQGLIDYALSGVHAINQGPNPPYKLPSFDAVSRIFEGFEPPILTPSVKWRASLGESVLPITSMEELSYGYVVDSFGDCLGIVLTNIAFELTLNDPGPLETIYKLGVYPQRMNEFDGPGKYLYVPSLRLRVIT